MGWFGRGVQLPAQELVKGLGERVVELERALLEARLHGATATGEANQLREGLMLERVRCDRLVDQVLELRREGFNPPPRPTPALERDRKVPRPRAEDPEGETAEDPVRAWDRIMGAIMDRAADNPQLRARMEIDCRRWREGGLSTELIVQRILHGWDGN